MNDVQVVNKNDFPLKGRFAAQDYVFLPGEPTAIPLAAAEHIFGMNDKDKTGALNRLQLLLPGNGSTYESAMAALRRVSFRTGRVMFAEHQQPRKPQSPPQPKHPQTQDPPEPAEEPERAPGVPGHQQPGPQPGTQHPGTQPQRGPGKNEELPLEDDEEHKESGVAPARRTDPGRKSEAGENPTPSSASGDLTASQADLDAYLEMLAVAHPKRKRT